MKYADAWDELKETVSKLNTAFEAVEAAGDSDNPQFTEGIRSGFEIVLALAEALEEKHE